MHLEWLAQQAATHESIIELGSWVGRSTRALCDNTPGHVWAVDMWKDGDPFPNAELAYNIFNENLKDHIETGKLSVLRGTTDAAFNIVFGMHTKPFFDMVFIDASHEYEQVKRDILNYRTVLRLGGLLCGHDLNHDGVNKAVNEIFGADYRALEYLWWVTI
jgi:predicted O-methyltransferase YrrM